MASGEGDGSGTNGTVWITDAHVKTGAFGAKVLVVTVKNDTDKVARKIRAIITWSKSIGYQNLSGAVATVSGNTMSVTMAPHGLDVGASITQEVTLDTNHVSDADIRELSTTWL